MSPEWFKPRGYKHFDRPVSPTFALKALDPNFVARHAFTPLIHYEKEDRRYDRSIKKTVKKPRKIMYASHQDACILSYYSHLLNGKLEDFYKTNGLYDNVIAYRALGQGNYDFAAEVYSFAVKNKPVDILAFDVTKFFDNLDHSLLKLRLKRMLGVSNLSDDWFRIFKHVTSFRFVELADLRNNPVFGPRLKLGGSAPVATMAEVKSAKIKIHKNTSKGVPQGTPISAALSNLYMIDFDVGLSALCIERGALYRRYSDDILIVCDPSHTSAFKAEVESLLKSQKLELSRGKTEVTRFSKASATSATGKSAQYLGFILDEDGVYIRQSSLARQWRKMKRAFRRTERVAARAIAKGSATKAYTRRLRKRFTPLQFRNFSSYGRRSARAFGRNSKIERQLRRFERAVEARLKRLAALSKPVAPIAAPVAAPVVPASP